MEARPFFLAGRSSFLQAAYDTGTLRLVGTLEALRPRPAWMRTLAALRQTE